MKRFCSLLVVLALIITVFVACTPVVDSEQTTENYDPVTTIGTQSPQPTQPIWQHEAALMRFLEDINHTGTIIPSTEPVPPGTLPEVWRIPQPNQDLVGQTVDIVLAQDQQAIPFYYSCSEAGVESLFVFIEADKIPMLINFGVQLGGIQGLYQHIQNETVFQGRIFGMKNLSFEEGNVYAYNVCSYHTDIPDNEILNEVTDLTVGVCMGVVGNGFRHGEETVNLLKGAKRENMSSQFHKDVDWMYQLLQRYGLATVNS